MPQTKERRKNYKNICVEVPNWLYEKATATADKQGMTKSELVRKLLAQEIER